MSSWRTSEDTYDHWGVPTTNKALMDNSGWIWKSTCKKKYIIFKSKNLIQKFYGTRTITVRTSATNQCGKSIQPYQSPQRCLLCEGFWELQRFFSCLDLICESRGRLEGDFLVLLFLLLSRLLFLNSYRCFSKVSIELIYIDVHSTSWNLIFPLQNFKGNHTCNVTTSAVGHKRVSWAAGALSRFLLKICFIYTLP